MTKTATPIENIKNMHHFVLTMLYNAQNNGGVDDLNHLSEEYWRGALNGAESVMDALGIEHEGFNPLHD